MKNILRVLSVMLCMALLTGTVPMDGVLLHAAQAEAVEQPMENEDNEISEGVQESAAPAEPADAEATPEPSADPTLEPSAEPTAEPSAVPTAEPTAEPDVIDYSSSAAKSPAFTAGYAMLTGGSTPLYEGKGKAAEPMFLLGKGAVYAIERSSDAPDRLYVAFNAGEERGILTGWVDANMLRPMNPESEVERFREICGMQEGILYYGNDSAIPLMKLECRTPEAEATTAPTAEPTTEPTPAPTAEPTIEPTVEPSAEPTVEPSAEPTVEPSAEPTVEPTVAPSIEPTIEPTAEPDPEITPEPTAEPEIPVTARLSHESAVIGVGDSGLQLRVIYSDGKDVNADGTPRTVLFSCPQTRYTSVNASGVVKGLRKGTATVTAYTDFGNFTCEITIKYAPTKISVKPASGELMLGEQGQLTPVYSSSSYGGTVRYESSDPSVAMVDENGLVTAVGKGTATISVYSFKLPKKPAKSVITVYAPASEISFAEEKLSLCVDFSRQLELKFLDYERDSCSYVSSDESIATVDANGMVHTLREGEVTITATASSGAEAKCELRVLPAPAEEDIALISDSFRLGVNESASILDCLQVSDNVHAHFSFESSNKRYVSVSADGMIKGVRKGTATITISSQNGIVRAVRVQVLENPKSVSFAESNLKIRTGTSAATQISFSRSGSYSLHSYLSSDESVATVDANGVITGISAGTATITVSPQKGKAGSCTVYVLDPPESISVAEAELSVGIGETGRRVIGVAPENTLCSFSYASMDESILTVDAATGEITTVAKGSAEVLVTADNGVTASCLVHVFDAPVSLQLSQSSLSICVGEKNTSLKPLVNEGAASGLSFKSSNTRYVKVQDGAIVGVAKGSATITATTYNGLTASCKVTVLAAPYSVAFAEANITIGVGQDAETDVKLTPSKSYTILSYTSSDPAVAAVDPATGVITGVGAGTATITAAPLSGKAGSCKVTVLAAPESIFLAEEEFDLGIGEAGRKVTPVIPEGTKCSFSYASSDEGVLRVDASTGVLTAVQRGTADITVTTHNGITAVCRVNVVNMPTMLELSHSSMKLMVGEKNGSLKGIVDAGAGSALTLKSSNSRYVKVEDGMLVGVKRGSATITATTYNGISASCKVTVYDAPKSMEFTESMVKLGCGEHVQAEVSFNSSKAYSPCSYASSDESIARVDPESGLISGVNAGIVTITAMSMNGISASCTAVVYPAPTGVRFEAEELTLSVGMEEQLIPVISGGAHGNCSFRSSNPGIVSVDAEGRVKAIAAGSAVISVTTYNNFKASCIVEVVAAPESLKYDFKTLSMLKGDTIRLPEPTAYDGDGNICPASYGFASSRSSIVSIDAEGMVKGLKTGSTVITAKSHNGVRTTFTLNVSNSIEGFALLPSSATLYVDSSGYRDSLQLNVSSASSATASLSYASSNPAVAEVSPSGLITAIAPGETTIIARAINGSFAEASICVEMLSSTLEMNVSELTIGEGEKFQLVPAFEEGKTAVVRYSTSDATIADVDESGLITGGRPGKALITAAMQNGVEATVLVDVLHAPSSIEMNVEVLRLVVGESVTLQPVLHSSFEIYRDVIRFASENEGIVSVNADGVICALVPGEATVTASACNGVSDAVRIEVVSAPQEASIAFAADSFSIVCGDSASVPVVLNKAAMERGYTITSSDPQMLSVEGLQLKANPINIGYVALTLSVNPDPAAPEQIAEMASCAVELVSMANVLPSAEEIEVRMLETAELSYALEPENLIGTFAVEVMEPELVQYDAEKGLVIAGERTGETQILFRTYNNAVACTVRVVAAAKYRALIIGEYNNSGSSKDLAFSANNVYNLRNTLATSSIGGERYEITGLINNPSKSQIRNALQTAFADATENDVSLVYIVSHGYYSATDSGYYGYHFSIAPNYNKANSNTYITSDELMSALRKIPGKVILVLDSCRSGGFIRDCSAELAAAGNISVLTAQSYDKYASFYVGKTKETTVEFLTYSLCLGMGVDQIRGTQPRMEADKNGDNRVSVSEAFNFARSETISQVASKLVDYDPNSKTGLYIPGGYFNGWSQNPQIYIAPGMENLPILGR